MDQNTASADLEKVESEFQAYRNTASSNLKKVKDELTSTSGDLASVRNELATS